MSETQKFLDIPVRGCGVVSPSWWNLLRSAGLRLEQMLGSGVQPETQQTIADNQSSAANITGLLFDETSVVKAKVIIGTLRQDGTNERVHISEFWVWYNATKGDWRMGSQNETGESCDASSCTSVASGVTFSITAAGQVQYTSDSMGGSYVGKMRWKVVYTIDLET